MSDQFTSLDGPSSGTTLPKSIRNLLAYARRYAHNRPLAAADVSAELVRVWPQLPKWEQEQHRNEILAAIARSQAGFVYWEAVLALPVKAE